MKNSNESAAQSLMYRLISQWPVSDPSVMKGKHDEIVAMISEFGEHRAENAVMRVIRERASDFFPPIAIIRQYVPATRDESQAAYFAEMDRLRPIRAAHPDDFFGEPDLIVGMRIISERIENKMPMLSSEALWKQIIGVRHATKARRQ